jgi:hypothetical protein
MCYKGERSYSDMKTNSIADPYHVVAVFYLDRGRELCGSDFTRLWSTTQIFGNHEVTGDFWHPGTIPTGTRRTAVGSLDLIRPLLDLGEQPIFGGGKRMKSVRVKNAILDCDFYYAHTSTSRSFGYDTTPRLLFSVSGEWFEHVGSEPLLERLREHLEVVDRYESPYGLIDLSASDDCYGGMVYEPYFVQNARLHRWVEGVKWLYASSKRRDQARGIYWGNYFGVPILERLGGREDFLSRFRQQARYQDGRPSARIWEFTNGVFVSLCIDPLGCRPGLPLDGWAAQNMHWLVLELGSHGVLDPWSKEGLAPT